MTVTQEDIDAVVAFWQPRLGLEKWRIRASIVGAGTLEGAYGDSDWCAESRTATIRIREDQPCRDDFLDTVIHELLHPSLWFVKLDKDDHVTALLEQWLRDVCPSLVSLSRDLIWPAQPKRKP